MHRLPVKSKLVDSGSDSESTKLGFGGNNHNHNQPLCPKPRRLGPNLPEFLIPLRCGKHSQPSSDGRSGISNIISDKGLIDGRECKCIGCYSGSPPGRTDNPVVNDVQFLHQMELLTRTKLSDQFGFPSANPMSLTN